MADLKKVIQCPSCKFANRLGDKRCLICKAELPETPPAPSDAAAAAPARGVNAASNAAAAARAAASKPPPGVIRKVVDPFAAKTKSEATEQIRRSPALTELRKAADEGVVAAGNGATEERKTPPKPLTRRAARPGTAAAADAVAWLLCDPLPAIPLVSGKQVIVGRQDTCDLCLPHKEVSRAHAVFKVAGKQITLEDQGSSNGCYVNGKRSATHIVKIGDLIQIGPYEIEVRAEPEIDQGSKLGDTKSFDLTSIGSGGVGASMTGKLSDVPLVEILQQIEFNSRTCTLAISDGKLKGQILFASGRPMTATFGAERDLGAVRAMLRLKEGRFVLSNEIDPTEATMNTTVTALLLDASREIDEQSIPSEPATPEEQMSDEPPPSDAYGGFADEAPPSPEGGASPEQEPPSDGPQRGENL